ncbi:MAG: DUF2799 domain-containing protein [Desulfobacteraceae bacterium]|nr:DUF2799 domain-containing protein [Desulfobacteraceae bacterium]
MKKTQKRSLPWPGLIIGVLLSFILSACATLNKDECFQADWYTIGYEDGAKGYQVSRIANHRKACAKYGVSPNFDLYQKGRTQGLKSYCTPRNGFEKGKMGLAYNNVCPDNLNPRFLDAYHQGRAIYLTEQDIKKNEDDLEDLRHQVEEINNKIAKKEKRLVQDGISSTQRKKLLQQIRNLEKDKRRLRKEIGQIKDVLFHLNQDLVEMESACPFL